MVLSTFASSPLLSVGGLCCPTAEPSRNPTPSASSATTATSQRDCLMVSSCVVTSRADRRALQRFAQYPLALFLRLVALGGARAMTTTLLVIVILLLIGALPTWPYSSGWGYYPSGGLGLVLLILIILMLAGRVYRKHAGDD